MSIVIFSCSEEYDDSAIWAEINSIKSNIDKINQDLNVLHDVVTALQNNDYVTKVEQTGNGYTLFFSSGKNVSITNGEDGDTPLISIKKDTDGKYYWVQIVNGEDSWIVDSDNNKLSAMANPPAIGINNNYNWTVDYGEGPKEILLNGSPISAKGEKGDSMFSDVIIDNDGVDLVLTDGSVLSFPFMSEFDWGNNPDSLIFDYSNKRGVYIKVGDISKYEVACTHPTGWSVEVITYPGEIDSYTCIIQAPNKDALMYEEEGEVIIFVSDKQGAVFMKSIKVKLTPMYLIDFKSIDWEYSPSNIYHVYDKHDRLIAEICKEYINTTGCVSVVVYPANEEGIVDLTKGVLAYSFVGNSYTIDNNAKWGYISWDEMHPSLEEKYATMIEKVTYKNGKILTNDFGGSLSPVKITPYMINDVRGDESISYGIVKIGNQYWMRENLKTTKYSDGSNIGDGTVSASGKSYVAFNELNGNIDSESKQRYGLMYNMYAMSATPDGNLMYDVISPEGWHFPTSNDELTEWGKLREYLGGNTWQDKVKSLEWGGSANNLSGLNILPGGVFNTNGFSATNMITAICAYTPLFSFGAYFPVAFNSLSDYNISGFGSDVFSYIRCIRDY